MRKKEYYKYGSLFVFIIVSALTFFVLKPFLGPIIISILIAYVSYPIFKLIHKYIKNRNIVSVLTILVIILTLVIPLLFIVTYLGREIPTLYVSTLSTIEKLELNYIDLEIQISEYFGFEVDIPKFISMITSKVLTIIQKFLTSIPEKFLHFTLTIFLLFFLLKDGEKFSKSVFNLLPFKKKYRDYLLQKVEGASKAIIYGQIITAFGQSIIATIGFLLLGIDPIVFGLLTFFACLIPYVGAPVIYIPISAYLLLQGLTTSNYVLVIKALGMFLYGLFVISLVDNFIKPTVLSSRTDIHIGFMVLGVIGGIIFFGIIGFILGPLILVLFFSLLTIYEDMKNPGII
ncbi:AI-2E family transporter [archaeon]|jgi:predicted PurR-regulated permease PerM|nr:AI-2E family transporter [archaeon]MBT4351336.1 AI-2E family transporter [archaeon]MBT4647001.1 AI-2E family transporter [archaeon]MBT6822477.1 AI-2E family transporter [archaeon]MBT7392006.1 AI-2E family transporter [archaeon]